MRYVACPIFQELCQIPEEFADLFFLRSCECEIFKAWHFSGQRHLMSVVCLCDDALRVYSTVSRLFVMRCEGTAGGYSVLISINNRTA